MIFPSHNLSFCISKKFYAFILSKCGLIDRTSHLYNYLGDKDYLRVSIKFQQAILGFLTA